MTEAKRFVQCFLIAVKLNTSTVASVVLIPGLLPCRNLSSSAITGIRGIYAGINAFNPHIHYSTAGLAYVK